MALFFWRLHVVCIMKWLKCSCVCVWLPVAGGRLNGQRLLELAAPVEGSELRVKSAVLWLRMEPRAGGPHRNVTLWAFRLLSAHLPNATHLSGKVCHNITTVNSLQLIYLHSTGSVPILPSYCRVSFICSDYQPFSTFHSSVHCLFAFSSIVYSLNILYTVPSQKRLDLNQGPLTWGESSGLPLFQPCPW